MSYVYIQSEPGSDFTGGLWTVGFYKPDGKWVPSSDHDNETSAEERVNWLNGGRKDAEQIRGLCEEREELIRENEELRHMLARQCAGSKLYEDDGELQDNSAEPFIDFKRDKPWQIRVAIYERMHRQRAAAGTQP